MAILLARHGLRIPAWLSGSKTEPEYVGNTAPIEERFQRNAPAIFQDGMDGGRGNVNVFGKCQRPGPEGWRTSCTFGGIFAGAW